MISLLTKLSISNNVDGIVVLLRALNLPRLETLRLEFGMDDPWFVEDGQIIHPVFFPRDVMEFRSPRNLSIQVIDVLSERVWGLIACLDLFATETFSF